MSDVSPRAGSQLRRVSATTYRVIAETADGLCTVAERSTLTSARSLAKEARRAGVGDSAVAAGGTEIWAVRSSVEGQLEPMAAGSAVSAKVEADAGWLDNCDMSGSWQPSFAVQVPTPDATLSVVAYGRENAYTQAANIAAHGRVETRRGTSDVTGTVMVVRMEARFIERVMRTPADHQLG